MDKKVFSNFFYNTLYQLVLVALPFITIPFISRVLGVEAIGTNSYILAVSGFFAIFGVLGIGLYGNKEIAAVRNNKKELTTTFYTIYLFQLVAHFVVILIYLFFFVYINNDSNSLLFLIQSIFIIGSIFDISWFMKGIEDFKKLTIRNLFIRILSVILVFLLIRDPEDLWLYITINATSLLLGNLIIWKYAFRYLDIKQLKVNNFKRHAKNIFLLFIPVLFYQIYTTFDKILIQHLSSVAQLGYYDLAMRMIRIGLTLVTSLNVVMLPRIANLYSNKKGNEIQTNLHQTMMITLLISCITFVLVIGASPQFVPWFFGEDYLPVIHIIQISAFVLLINPIGSIFTLQLGLATGNNRAFIVPYVVGAIISLILNIIMIPKYGAIGASIVIVLTELLVCIIRVWIANSKISLLYVFNGSYKYIVASILSLTIILVIPLFLNVQYILINVIQGLLGIFIYMYLLYVLKEKNILFLVNQLIFKGRGKRV